MGEGIGEGGGDPKTFKRKLEICKKSGNLYACSYYLATLGSNELADMPAKQTLQLLTA